MAGRLSGKVVRAAGGVLWRRAQTGHVEVALVHRPRYDDWSLPKGKVNEGEHLLACAVREVKEETGHDTWPGRPLGTSRYVVLVNGRPTPKTVQWWALESVGGAFEATREVDQIRWLAPQEALRRIRAGQGTAALRRFLSGAPRTQTLLLVRHARAVAATNWAGEDGARPLDERGGQQARALSQLLSLYRPGCIVSSSAVRCAQTVAPLAAALDLPVDSDPTLGPVSVGWAPEQAHGHFRALLDRAGCVVVCAERDVVAALLAVLADRKRAPVGRGSTWALSYDTGRVVGTQYWPG